MYTPENQSPLSIPVMEGSGFGYPASQQQSNIDEGYRQGHTTPSMSETAPQNMPNGDGLPEQNTQQEQAQYHYEQPETDPLNALSAEERQMADDRLWRAVAKLVSHGAMTEVEKRVKPEIDELRQINMDAVDSMYFGELEDLASDWKTINDNQAFHQWLDERDPYSNIPRQQLLESAHMEHDAERVARFFNDFSQTQQTGGEQASMDPRVRGVDLMGNPVKQPRTIEQKAADAIINEEGSVDHEELLSDIVPPPEEEQYHEPLPDLHPSNHHLSHRLPPTALRDKCPSINRFLVLSKLSNTPQITPKGGTVSALKNGDASRKILIMLYVMAVSAVKRRGGGYAKH